MVTKKQNDFDAEKLIKASADHEKSLAELTLMVKRLDQRVGDSSSLAKSFKEAFDTDKKWTLFLLSYFVILSRIMIFSGTV